MQFAAVQRVPRVFRHAPAYVSLRTHADLIGDRLKLTDKEPVQLSLLVEGFALVDPAKHNEGQPEGFLRLAVNGADTLDTAQTTPTLSLAAGATILDAELLYSDGDSLEPAVTASLSLDVVAP